jgi:hypothetical protein
MSHIVINNHPVQIKEFNGQRVVTFKEIDLLHERPEGTANKRFLDNQKHFEKGQDYFEIFGKELKEIKRLPNFGIGLNASKTILITESGYLMLTKSLTDDLAWKVQRQLVNSYFRVKDIINTDNLRIASLLHAEVGELIEATNKIENRVVNLEQNMTIDYSQQLTLQEIAKSAAINAIGGKGMPAYKDCSLRGKVFSQVWRDYKEYFEVNSYKNTARIEFEKAKEYLKNWKAQGKVLREIESSNGQLGFPV